MSVALVVKPYLPNISSVMDNSGKAEQEEKMAYMKEKKKD